MIPVLAALLLALSSDPGVTQLAAGEHDETTVVTSRSTVVAAAIRRIEPAQPAWIDVYTSNDAGSTWLPPVRMPSTFDGVDYGYETDPALVVFDDGSFGLAFIALKQWPDPHLPQNPEALLFTRSVDGRTWSAPQVLVSGTDSVYLAVDRPFFAEDRAHGTVWLSYTSDATREDRLVLSSSTDRGVHWSAATPVNTNGHITPGQIAVTGDGTIVVAGFDTATGSLVRVTSSNGGASWNDRLTIGTDIANGFKTPVSKTLLSPIANMAAWKQDVYCVYMAKSGVYFTQSSNDGFTWSEPLQLGGAAGDAALPAVTVDDTTGDALVSWLDGRDDTAQAGTMRVYAAQIGANGAMVDAPHARSSSFDAGGRMGDVIGSTSVARAGAVTVFSTRDDQLLAIRLQFQAPPWRRAVSH